MTQSLLERDTAIMLQLVNTIVDASQPGAFFIPGADKTTDWRRYFARLSKMPDVVRANAIAQDRTVVWSTEPALVGRRLDAGDGLEQALLGIPQVGVTGDKTPNGGFVESILPIWQRDAQSARVVGVVTLYRAPAKILDEIESGRRFIWVGTSLAGLFLFAALFGLTRWVNTIMLRQEQRLVETATLANMGEMASAVAHGLRNPLASIRSAAELALESGMAPEVRLLLIDVVEQSDRLAYWVHQYLDETKLDGPELDKADIEYVIRSSVGNFQAELERRDVHHSLQMDPALPPAAISRFVLGQVLNGLVANAIEAMVGGGELSITARRRDATLQIDVMDTGPGIPAERLPDLLRPFKTTKNAGLGLGLPLANRLIERHGGSLTLSSEVGCGTRATLLLPLFVG